MLCWLILFQQKLFWGALYMLTIKQLNKKKWNPQWVLCNFFVPNMLVQQSSQNSIIKLCFFHAWPLVAVWKTVCSLYSLRSSPELPDSSRSCLPIAMVEAGLAVIFLLKTGRASRAAKGNAQVLEKNLILLWKDLVESTNCLWQGLCQCRYPFCL